MKFIKDNIKNWKLDDGRENFIFQTKLEVIDSYRGRSAFNVIFRDAEDKGSSEKYSMSISNFLTLVKTEEQCDIGCYCGFWTFQKQGSAISVVYLGGTI